MSQDKQKTEACKNCKFYTREKDKVGKGADGFCHLEPPKIFVQIVQGAMGQPVPAYITAYPQVNEEIDWCGKFEKLVNITT